MITLERFFNEITPLSGDEWEALLEISELSTFKKEQYIVQKDSSFLHEVFIEQGIVRAFLFDSAGNEKTTAFFTDGEFMSTSTLRTKNGRSMHFYQALCPSKLVFFPSDKIKSFLSQTKKLSKIGRAIKDSEIDRIFNRDKTLLQNKARDKYRCFLAHYPTLESKISQKYIASYLGITPVSLSRIKQELRKSQLITIDNNSLAER